ncbi:hypothetical protein Goshw_025865 [Gossypium schwendimanii]|uniref:DUF4283 domain-containing protein n=1 Tax=Gossypium schwendimanii TaxID=34291 RepID=A0A7J9L5U5_GOSSC|nr:hypothetical protein [Gossypium schwendimanii]
MENKLVDLHIREEEEEVLRVEEIVGDHKPVYDLCLVGFFVTASVVHFPAMCNTLANLWHPVIKGAPWTFNNHLLVFHCLVWIEECPRVPLIYSFFWVQDISLWVSRRKATTMESIGLRKGNMEDGPTGFFFAIGRDLMIHDLEKSLIGDFVGKKSQRVGGSSEGVYESSNFIGKCDE